MGISYPVNHLIKVAGFQVPITGWFWVPADNKHWFGSLSQVDFHFLSSNAGDQAGARQRHRPASHGSAFL